MRADVFAVGDEPQPVVIGRHPNTRVVQGHHVRATPFSDAQILKEHLNQVSKAVPIN